MSIDQLKSSGLLELYVMGNVTESEQLMIEKAIADNPSLKQEIKDIEESLEAYAQLNAIPTDVSTKPMILAMLDYSERLKNGEVPIPAPSLSPQSEISDFLPWLERSDMQEPDEYEAMHGKIISADDHKTTMIVWLKHGAPDETHIDEIEKFLVCEGSCNIIIGDQTHSLTTGDYIAIPLFVNHRVEVTSNEPCKVILERAAA